MHDGGGDRSHTVDALPQIIDGLRAKGFQFVPVSDLLGQTRAQVMPPLTHQEWLLARADAFIFDVFRWFARRDRFIFMAGILLVSGRALVIGLLALIEKLRPAPADHPDYKPPVTVLIPAYNEEDVIVNTVHSALASRLSEAGSSGGGRRFHRPHRRTAARKFRARTRACALMHQAITASPRR